MGCMGSFAVFNCFSQSNNSSSSIGGNNKSGFIDDLEDTVPLASASKKKPKHIIEDKQTNFSRIIPLLEKIDDTSTFRNVSDQLHLSNYNTEHLSSSESTVSLEDELSNSIQNNVFLNQILNDENIISSQPQIQNTFSENNDSNATQVNNQQNDEKLLLNLMDHLNSTEDEGGISGEMDSSCDDT